MNTSEAQPITTEDIPGGVVIHGAQFRQVSTASPAGAVLCRFEGRTPLEVFEPVRRVMEASIARHGRIVLIGDGSDWSSYGPGLREAWTAWLGEHRSSILDVHLLVRSTILKMGVQIVNMLLSGVITAYSDPAHFQSEVARLYPDVDLAPIRSLRTPTETGARSR